MLNSSTGPLVGLRAVELAALGPVPHCAMLLADLGATVTRVSRLDAQDAIYPVIGRGRRTIALDLKSDEGRNALLDLAADADILLEGFRPDVMERLGAGPQECLARNPRLVYGRVTGWGRHGPWHAMAGHDITYLAVTGVLNAIGRSGGPPQPPLNLVGDFGGGSMPLLSGILAALWERERSGAGQVVDVSIVEGTLALAAGIFDLRASGAWRDERGVNLLDTGAPYYDVYETADGRHMAVGALEPKFYAELVQLLDLRDAPDQDDQCRWPELRRRIAGRFLSGTQQEWTATFAGTDACVAPVLTFDEAAEHPQLRALLALVERDGVLQPAPTPHFSRTPTELPATPVAL